MSRSTKRTEHVEVPIAPDILKLVRHAAEIEGRSVGAFIVDAAQEAARRTIEQTHFIRLAVQEQQRFPDLLLAPHALPPAMARAARAHQKLIAPSR